MGPSLGRASGGSFWRGLLRPALSLPGSGHHVTMSLPEINSGFERGDVFSSFDYKCGHYSLSVSLSTSLSYCLFTPRTIHEYIMNFLTARPYSVCLCIRGAENDI